MIRINLLGETVDKSGLYLIQLIVFGFALIMTSGFCYVMYDSVASEVVRKDKEIKTLTLRLAKLKSINKKVQGLEDKKKLLQEKLLVISRLKANKRGPVRILDELNTAVPERAWLDTVLESGGQSLEIKGIALDNPTVALFMANLEKSDYFEDVELLVSITVHRDEAKLKSFSLTSKIIDPLMVQKAKSEREKALLEKESEETRDETEEA